jgi:hypothetical protein
MSRVVPKRTPNEVYAAGNRIIADMWRIPHLKKQDVSRNDLTCMLDEKSQHVRHPGLHIRSATRPLNSIGVEIDQRIVNLKSHAAQSTVA